jgi:5-methylcytosine-specific restriction endonuclease McrA
MPINYADYPDNWLSEIRPRILERDGHRCKFCRVPDGVTIQRSTRGHYMLPSGEAYDGTTGALLANEADHWPPERKVRIVLTIAHLDHALVDHSDANLAALCQQCHLRHDKRVTAPKAAYTKKYGRASLTIVFLP